jgi:hypothetical protein
MQRGLLGRTHRAEAPSCACQICPNETGSRYWSNRYAMGLPFRSVTVVTIGKSALARFAEMLSTESDSWLDASPNPMDTGAITPASRTPANRHRPRNRNTPTGTRTGPSVPITRCDPCCRDVYVDA